MLAACFPANWLSSVRPVVTILIACLYHKSRPLALSLVEEVVLDCGDFG